MNIRRVVYISENRTKLTWIWLKNNTIKPELTTISEKWPLVCNDQHFEDPYSILYSIQQIATFEQRPLVNNSRKLYVPRVVVVRRFDFIWYNQIWFNQNPGKLYLTYFANFVNVFVLLFGSTVCFRDLAKLNLPMVVRFLSSSQFLILPQLPQKLILASKVVKVDSKIIILLPKI